MQESGRFEVGRCYRLQTGTFEVVGRDGDWLRVRMDDGRVLMITEHNASRALRRAEAPAATPIEQRRLRHDCEGTPCGPACVKLRGTEGERR